MSGNLGDPLVSTEWLGENLDRDDLKVVDGSWYLPAENRDPKAEYADAHIRGAVYFDIDAISDTASSLPHMFPSADFFAGEVGKLGISNGDTVVCYDGGKMSAAGRAWWMFRAFGHTNVAVLDGGFGKWRAEGRPVDGGWPEPAQTTFTASTPGRVVRDVEEMLRLTGGEATEQILDARAAGRFNGTQPEPRAGMRSGHMPGAFNLPYTDLLAADGTMRPVAELRALFERAGIDTAKPVVTSCGSGVSATVLLLGLRLLGNTESALYDGSWSEWGSRQDTPVVT